MSGTCKISESEWEIMKVIWDNHPITSDKIINLLSDNVQWSDQTIKTFINRLVKKNILGYNKSGRYYHYYPLVLKEECIRNERQSFIQRVYNGSVGMMLSNFLEESHLSDNEIEKLKKILNEKQEKR